MIKNLTYLFVILTICFASCKKENNDELKSEGSLQFGVSLQQTKLKVGTTTDAPAAIVVSITDPNGKVVVESKRISLLNMNGSYLSEPLSLTRGSYQITKFIVLDNSDQALYATPLKNSKFAYLVNAPLPIAFSIDKDKVTKLSPEVISAKEATFEDFGYESFSFSIVKTFNFLVSAMTYNEGVKNWELASAHINIKSTDGAIAYDGELAAITNPIILRDNSENFTLTISKEGYQNYVAKITANDLKLFCKSEDKGPLIVKLFAESDVVKDIDGNVYHTVKIGTQVWMVENLSVTKYNDGTAIPNVTDNSWLGLTTGAYCWYNNDRTFKTPYGALYNWHAVNSGKLAPAGWHVPTLADWNKLCAYLSNAGGPLKEIGLDHWESPNGEATNQTGFTAVAAGGRRGNFVNMSYFSTWWSATEYNSASSYEWTLRYNDGAILSLENGKAVGNSVRCIRD